MRSFWRRSVSTLGAVLLVILAASPVGVLDDEPALLLVDLDGQPVPNIWSFDLSHDGTSAAFESASERLVEHDRNGAGDVFVRNLVSGELTLVSVASDGTQGNDDSSGSAISGDGTVLAFDSEASNLVDVDTNDRGDVFVHDRTNRTTTLVSVASDGSQANGDSSIGGISADGRLVVFESTATNLVDGDTNGASDVFVHDRVTGTTVRASVSTMGVEADTAADGSDISADGSVVVFTSEASTLVAGDTNGVRDVFTHHLATGATTRVSTTPDGRQRALATSGSAAVSGDGSVVVYGAHVMKDPWLDGPMPFWDVFTHDTRSAVTTLISIAMRASGSFGGRRYRGRRKDHRLRVERLELRGCVCLRPGDPKHVADQRGVRWWQNRREQFLADPLERRFDRHVLVVCLESRRTSDRLGGCTGLRVECPPAPAPGSPRLGSLPG